MKSRFSILPIANSVHCKGTSTGVYISKLKQLMLFLTLLIPFYSNTQTPNLENTNNQQNKTEFKCGVDAQTAALIKQRLMSNRELFSKQEVADLTSNRVITYIPLSIHNVQYNGSGLGKTSEATILGFVCGLNALYADQDVQFFIHNTIYTRNSTFIYDNAGSTTSRNHMMSYRVANTLNLIIGSSANNQVASWYDGFGDFIFLLQSMLSSQAKTEAHEIGHFFTLPHTFNGWESMNVLTSYPGGTLTTCGQIGSGWSGFTPERVARAGFQSNCNTAADGFCDTPADYYSDRLPCPFPAFNDCYGNALTPDEDNIMSYASDVCVNKFSLQQKSAIAVDIASRNWVTNTPVSTAAVTGIPAPVSPLDGAQLGNVNNATVRLEWTPISGATWYYIEVYGTMFPGLWLVNTNDVIYKGISYSANPYFNLPTTNLVAGGHYAWHVKALNSYSTCANISGYSDFEAVASVTTAIKDLPIEKQMSLKINSNPISTSFIPLTIYAAEEVVGSIRIYSMDGREVLTLTKQTFGQGESLIQLPAEDLTNGIYVAVLSTDRGLLQQKLTIQR